MKKVSTGWEVTTTELTRLFTLFTLVGGVFTFGVAWGAAKWSLDSKVDAKEYAEHVKDFTEYTTVLRRIDTRVADMYCADKPPGCR